MSTKMPGLWKTEHKNEDELNVNVTGLYVPYEENFVREAMF